MELVAAFGTFLIITIFFGLYMSPAIYAHKTNHPHSFLIGMLLGWGLIIWPMIWLFIISLIWVACWDYSKKTRHLS